MNVNVYSLLVLITLQEFLVHEEFLHRRGYCFYHTKLQNGSVSNSSEGQKPSMSNKNHQHVQIQNPTLLKIWLNVSLGFDSIPIPIPAALKIPGIPIPNESNAGIGIVHHYSEQSCEAKHLSCIYQSIITTGNTIKGGSDQGNLRKPASKHKGDLMSHGLQS